MAICSHRVGSSQAQLGGFCGRSRVPLSSANQRLANDQAARCDTCVTKPVPSTSEGVQTDGSFPNDPKLCRYERGVTVTAETVNKLCHQGHLAHAVEALAILVQRHDSISTALVYTVLKKCVDSGDLVLGRRVHALTVEMGYQSDTFLSNHILRMYVSHGKLQDAMHVFTMVVTPDAFVWSSIISAHVKHGQDMQAIQLYRRMRRSSVKPDAHVFVAALQACARGAYLSSGQELHYDVLTSGLGHNLFVCNSLINMYAKCGMGQEALRLYSAMQQEGIAAPDSVTFVCLLQACASLGNPALEKGRQLHAQLRERGHEAHVRVANSLVSMYAKCGSLRDAQRVFQGLREKNVVTWNAMIAGYSQQGMGQDALRLLSAMEEEGITTPDSVTFVCALQACASVGALGLDTGKHLHAQIREQALQTDVVVGCSLVNMYAKCGSLEDAQLVFDGLHQKNVVTWTSLIGGYSQQNMGQEALGLYAAMQQEGVAVPDSVTFVCLLLACANVGTLALDMGKQLHAQVRYQGLLGNVSVANSLVNMYAKCGSLEEAQKVFDDLGQKDVVTWTALIAGYSQQGMVKEALLLYSAMQEEGVAVPSSVTFMCLLQACANEGTPALEKGRQLHAQIEEQEFYTDVIVASCLVHMYAKCGSLEDAQSVFDGLQSKDVVTWNAMIAGYTQQGMGQEALYLYGLMQEDGTSVPNSVTFVCLLQACANLAALHLGRKVHAQIQEQELQVDVSVAISLINMYGKCGSMIDAQQVFDVLLSRREAVSWNALIAGYTRQGDSEVVFDLVQKMREEGTQPDGITFLSVLTVCSHAGLLNKGRECFISMSSQYGICPSVEHHTCLVDLLGRAGRLDEALAVIRTMPVLPNAAVWHTLLGACQKWGNVDVGSDAFDEAVKIDYQDATAYLLMSNIYKGDGMWEQAQDMQSRRIKVRAWKRPGQSWWTDMAGLVHSFVVGDRKHLKRVAEVNQLVPRAGDEGDVFRFCWRKHVDGWMGNHLCVGTPRSWL